MALHIYPGEDTFSVPPSAVAYDSDSQSHP